jgi:hypothetical protein
LGCTRIAGQWGGSHSSAISCHSSAISCYSSADWKKREVAIVKASEKSLSCQSSAATLEVARVPQRQLQDSLAELWQQNDFSQFAELWCFPGQCVFLNICFSIAYSLFLVTADDHSSLVVVVVVILESGTYSLPVHTWEQL